MLAAILTAALSLAPPCGCGPDCPCGPACACFVRADTPKLEVVDPSGYRWERFPDGNPAWLQLTRDGKQVGSYEIASGVYLPWDGHRFGAAGWPPLAVPKELPKAAPAAVYRGPVYYQPHYTLPSGGGCRT